MKSERRHELQHNALREWLTVNYERVKPFQNTIFGVVLLVAMVFLAVSWWSKRSASHDAAAWDAMYRALKPELPAEQQRLLAQNPLAFYQRYGDPQMAAQRDPARLDKVAEQYPNTPAADWAAVMAGDLYQLAGANQLFVDKAEANKQLSEAVKHYDLVKSTAGPLLRQRAMFGLAQTLESQGRIEQAVAKYQELAKTWPNGMFAKTADERAKDLQRPEMARFYDEFQQFKPQPPSPPKEETSSGTPSKNTLTPPSDNPPEDFSVPSPFGKLRPKDKSGKTAESPEPPKPGPEKKTEAPPEKTKTAGELSVEKKTEITAEPTPPPPDEKTIVSPKEKTAEKRPETPAEKTPEKPAAAPEKPAEKTAGAPAEKPAEKTPEKPAAVPEKPAEKTAEPPAEKPAEKTAEPSPEPPAKPVEKTEKTSDTAPEKPAEKTTEKTGDGK